jgi:hypothetical protein
LLPQVQNYNRALTEISGASRYCKIVQADDYIFPECLRLMVQAFERSESIGLVSSYYLKGDTIRGSGFPAGTPILPGREMAGLFLRKGIFVFGSPTTVMYRSALVKDHPFYDETLLHEDTEKCMQILERWDFGFVHQVLSFLRTDNESISSQWRTFQPEALDWYIIAQRYASVFLEPQEAAALKRAARKMYYRGLAQQAVRFRGAGFWRYHKAGLKTLGERLDGSYIALQVGLELLWLAANPGATALKALHFWKHRAGQKRER